MLPYSELMHWQNAAEFVANFIDYELLDEPTELVGLRNVTIYTPLLQFLWTYRKTCRRLQKVVQTRKAVVAV